MSDSYLTGEALLAKLRECEAVERYGPLHALAGTCRREIERKNAEIRTLREQRAWDAECLCPVEEGY